MLTGAFFLFSACQIDVEKRGEAVDFTMPEISDSARVANDGVEQFQTVHFSTFDSSFRFSGDVPSDWHVEYIPELTAINVFNPSLEASDTLERSQFFIRQFQANDFLTLSTVTIHAAIPIVVNGHAGVQYDIEKKPSVADFPGQPAWRSERHTVVDIRFAETNPSLFYVFGYSPDVDESIFEKFINSLEFDNDISSFTSPMDRPAERINKKEFGTYVTPQDSPVDPERFNGYHTAVDFEVFENESSSEVPVVAFCGGEIVQVREVSGYGGLLVQRCVLEDKPVTVYYGHVAVDSARVEVGEYVVAGQQLVRLGQGFSEETDGERKHLHFGVHKGSEIRVAGYVGSESELEAWIDPMVYINN